MDTAETHVVAHKGKTYAIFFNADIGVTNGVKFLTQDEDPIQVGIFERAKGYKVDAHKHAGRTLDLPHVGEFLWIQSGSAIVRVLNEDWNLLEEREVRAGDCVILLCGGHEFTMTSDTRILEVKQGPYPGRAVEKVFRELS